ncbi:hypothetical protein B0A52_03648 [Exophiala mesophila]|uniref:RRM domain-containing protein n=1 Tax=Exophiala mesophila TaxID=212818 RepID=A0A438NA31_EXOME|nr:hypothetical protein B0A52_03648 [Exophiala mesophila]
MSYPTPPGFKPATSQPPASLPARPPQSAVNPISSFKSSSSAKPAFTAFAPRSVASANQYRTNSPAQYSAPPVPSYNVQSSYPQSQSDYSSKPHYDASSYSSGPAIRNPFVPNTESSAAGYPPGFDPEYEAQVQQWQSAYMSKDSGNLAARPAGASTGTSTPAPAAQGSTARPEQSAQVPESSTDKTVQRSGGGTSWTDSTLLEWDPAHFRIFVGNLAGEVTDESLLKAFSQYPSVQKARVIRDKRTTKSKGYGFVSFADGDDYFRAAREQNGKYIGSHPIIVKKAMTDVRATTVKQNNPKGKKGGSGGHGKVQHGGVNKKQSKTKGGLKVLG